MSQSHARLAHWNERREAEPCAILPAQFSDGSALLTGEQKLLIAMLDDVIRVYRRGIPAHRSARPRRELRAARAWVDADDPTFPFSLPNVCAFLGLDVTAIRRGLRKVDLAGAGATSPPPARPGRRPVPYALHVRGRLG